MIIGKTKERTYRQNKTLPRPPLSKHLAPPECTRWQELRPVRQRLPARQRPSFSRRRPAAFSARCIASAGVPMHSPIAPHDGPGEGQSSSSSALSSSVAPARNGSALSTRKAANLPLQRSPRATNNDAPRKPTNLLFTKRHKQIGWVDRAAVFVVDNQIRMSLAAWRIALLTRSDLPGCYAGLSLFILFTLGILYLVSPALRPSIDKFYLVSYHSPATGRHGKGTDDAYFVFFWIVVFTFLRAAAFDYVFIPLARVGGVRSPKALVRFSEQAWLLAYYSIIWPLGMVSCL